MKPVNCFCCICLLFIIFPCCGKQHPKTDNQITESYVFDGQDALGNRITLVKYPERIISLAPSNTEIIYALGIQDRLVGRTRYCNYPPQTEFVEIVGGFVDINVERILSLKPDLVLAVRGNPRKVLKEIDRLGMNVFALEPKDINDVVGTLLLVGELTGVQKKARALTRQLTERIEAVTRKISDIPRESWPKVFYGDWKPPISAAGVNNPIDSLITMAGGSNIARDAGVSWPRYSFERILAHNPDIILSGFKSNKDLEKEHERLISEIQQDPLWSTIKAVQTKKIFFIDEDIVMRPGPRMVDALEIMARYFHPAAFKADRVVKTDETGTGEIQ